MATFVLVHGAWHGGWCWERLTPLLRAAGHTVHAPDLPGMGNDRTPLAGVTLAQWADAVAGIVRKADEPVVLVGHSRGGVVISEAAERVPERIAKLVYLAAFLVPDGKTLADMLALFPPRPVAVNIMAFAPDGTTSTIPSDKVGPVFYNTTAAPLVAEAQRKLTPEPMMSFVTPLALTDARFGKVPRVYVECTEDNAIPIELQRIMHAALPCKPVVTMKTDHSPFFSAPDELARALLALA